MTRAAVTRACIVLAFALVGCDLDLRLPSEPKDEPPEPVDIDDDDPAKPKKIPGKGQIELGTATWPAGASSKGAAQYAFDVPPKHRVGYAITKDEQGAVADIYAAFARRVKFKRTGEKTFEWVPPKGCPSDLSCVYRELIDETKSAIGPLAKRFRARADAAKLDAVQLAQVMLAFVQQIPYHLPDDPFGLKPPPLVLAQKSGDCDSKALLLYLLLRAVGIDSVIVTSAAHRHTMLGVALPVPGTTFRWNGRKYAFAETTAKGAPLGYLPPDVSTPNDWRVELAEID